jgi:hypothetical protein
MRITAMIPIVIFFGMAVVVGLRLLSLWRKTRQLPELCIGLGIVLISAVGMPLSVLGRLPNTVGTRFGNVVFAMGLSLACGGIALLFAFTWRVFRSDAGWARLAMLVASLAMVVLDLGLIRAASQGSTLSEVIPRTRPWAVGIVSMVVLAFAWGGFEALRYFHLLRRRQALGLADPVVTNRFLLWAVADWTAVVLCGSVAGFLLAGKAVLVDPLALCVIALTGTVMSATWYLTFFPPAAYLRYVGHGPGEGADAGPGSSARD